ncbi:MAG: GTP 3',8-cyclase MoaA [Desulfofustis sp.]|nr:GTP 3',8-cyclase MoaA [Desulfofustis sp.]
MRIDHLTNGGAASSVATAPLIDNHGRSITYLRLAITDRCNLRCRYCMPEQGVAPIAHDQTLSYEELERLVAIFLSMGITKVRVTGGEPFVRRGCIDFLGRLKGQSGVKRLHVTTNGVETAAHLSRLQQMGIDGINLSLDTLDRQRFLAITRRDRLGQVLATLHGALAHGIKLKINSVVDEDTSDAEIVALADLARSNTLCLRFIEKMPFSGSFSRPAEQALVDRLRRLFPGLAESRQSEISTARQFGLPGFLGSIGIIEGHSRRFCSTCNKLRVTPSGMLKTCLYDDGVLDLRELLRSGTSDATIAAAIRRCVGRRFTDGHETEKSQGLHNEPSMATIGG